MALRINSSTPQRHGSYRQGRATEQRGRAIVGAAACGTSRSNTCTHADTTFVREQSTSGTALKERLAALERRCAPVMVALGRSPARC